MQNVPTKNQISKITSTVSKSAHHWISAKKNKKKIGIQMDFIKIGVTYSKMTSVQMMNHAVAGLTQNIHLKLKKENVDLRM